MPWPGWLRAFSAGGEGEDGDGGHYGGHLGEDEEGDGGRHSEGSRLWIPRQGTVGWARTPAQGELHLFSFVFFSSLFGITLSLRNTNSFAISVSLFLI